MSRIIISGPQGLKECDSALTPRQVLRIIKHIQRNGVTICIKGSFEGAFISENGRPFEFCRMINGEAVREQIRPDHFEHPIGPSV
jgi:hypothetical protein